ncbi:MAG: class I SAM-dependent methyltransferase [Dehalococcoidia bacterium]
MRFYRDRVYPRLVSLLGDPKPIREIRRRLIPLAQGNVLELGVGPGANFPHYDPARVSKLYALEPNQRMVRLADRQWRPAELDVEFLTLPGEDIPLEDGSVDTVVSTFTLCTVADPSAVVRSIRRALKPEGKFIFFELGLSADHRVRRWQAFWAPVHRLAFEGLHMTRDIPALITQGGFALEGMENGYLAQFPKSWTHYCAGTAIRGGIEPAS